MSTTSPYDVTDAGRAADGRAPGIRASPAFLRLWAGQAVNQVGDQVYLLALPWLVYNLSHSGSQMSLVFTLGLVPYVAFGLVGGAASDSGHRRAILVTANAAAGLVPIALYALSEAGVLRPWHVYVAVVVLSCVVSYALPAFESAIPTLVPPSLIGRANAMTEVTNTLTLVMGPAIAGAVVSAFTVPVAMLLDGLSFLVAAAVFATIRGLARAEPQPASTRARPRLAALIDGLRYVPGHAVLRWAMILSTAGNLVLGGYDVILVYYLRVTHHLTAAQVGQVLAVASVASVLVAMVLAKRVTRMGAGRLIVLSAVGQGLSGVLVGLAPDVAVIMLGQALFIGSTTMFTINWRTLRQRVTPPALLGRVSGACRGVAYTGAVVGGLIGAAALHAGAAPQVLFAAEGGVVALLGASALASRLAAS